MECGTGTLQAGADFLNGVLPSPKAYPIWGYSFFSQVMEEHTPILQSFLLFPLVLLTSSTHWSNCVKQQLPLHSRFDAGFFAVTIYFPIHFTV